LKHFDHEDALGERKAVIIKVEKLSKSFGLTKAVDDISFDVSKGEVVGLLGPNGAGKTTTMRLLTNYLVADSGYIRIAGLDIEEEPLAARKNIGYLPESAPLYNDLNVIEYLEYVASIHKIPADKRRNRVKKMVEDCGLGDVLSRSVGVLSKGYRQRVGLAQTMIHDPGILILDEPTTGLDPNQIVEIRELIKKIGEEKTIIISTHILPEVRATCGRILIINRGAIVADGTPSNLAEKQRGEDIYFVKAKGEKAALDKALEKAPFIDRFEPKGGDGGAVEYMVHGTTTDRDLGEALFELAVAEGFVLVEMRRESVSLENVFSSLTLGEYAS